MQPLTFSKKQILLSLPGLVFFCLGISTIGEDPYTAILLLLWGVMLTPIFWIWVEVQRRKPVSFLQKVGIFFIVLLVVAVISPETEPRSIPAQGGTQDIKEVVVQSETSLPSSTPDSEVVLAIETPPNSEKETGVEAVDGTEGLVISVTDGDTLKVNLNGVVETIRVIGIDTPETVHPTKLVECFGIEASNKAKALLTGSTVRVVTDSSQGTRDKYDRYLAYITLEDGSDFGETMLRGGYAYEYTYGVPYQNQSTYKAAEATARTTQTGLWADGACGLSNSAPEAYVAPVSPAPAPVPQTTEANCTIKGNISYSTGEKIYHVPGQENYTDTVIDTSKGESWFCTESEAVAAGWRKAKR